MLLNESPRVLIADDQDDICVSLQLALKGHGFQTETVRSPEAALAAVARQRFDVVLMDLNYARDTTSGGEGLDLLNRMKAVDPAVRVIAMTGWGTIDLAVEVMRRGATDFVLKPWDNAALVRTVRAQAEIRALDAPPSAAAVTRAAHDLDIARRVQTQLLPQHAPRLATAECAAQCVEAGAVGGDGYDFLDLGSGRLLFFLADVSGKGLPAALLWANLQATLRGQPERAFEDLPALLGRVNRLFHAATAPEHYATLFLGVYDDATRRLRYVNCGHNPPVLLRKDGVCEMLPSTAPVVGLMEDWPAEAAERTLHPGDTLLVYSDGVTEAHDAADEEYGEERLTSALRAYAGLPLADVPRVLLAEILAFAGPRPQDDRTVLALRGV